GDVQPLRDLLPLGNDLVDPILGLQAALLGGPEVGLAVLVGPREEEDLLAIQAVVPGDDVTRHRGIGVPDVRHVVDVIDGCGDVEGVLHGPAIVGRLARSPTYNQWEREPARRTDGSPEGLGRSRPGCRRGRLHGARSSQPHHLAVTPPARTRWLT